MKKNNKRMVKQSARGYYKVRHEYTKLQNYLEERGAWLSYEDYEAAYYKRTPYLLSLIEDYTIDTYCFPNRI